MSRYTNLLVCELERRLKHFTDRAITHLPLIQNECILAGQSAVNRASERRAEQKLNPWTRKRD
jgi:hypothetical protein